ncbi:MAG TPA: hypothetical protein VLX58_16895 [Bryobacteraceae bacterium]|nr:hypothetical protein [Bryobacteraceae bacterium]
MNVSTRMHLFALAAAIAAGGDVRAQAGAQLKATDEYRRPDPFGGIVAADHGDERSFRRALSLEAARGGYASFHLDVEMREPGPYTLTLRFDGDGGKLQAELFREWFHFTESDKHYYPDALIPVPVTYHSQLPEPDNRIPNQTAQAFWVDFWIAADARPGTYRASAALEAAGSTSRLPIELKVLPAVIPNDDAIVMDHNSYGSSWIADEYPAVSRKLGDGFYQSDEFFRLIHAYHRIFYEHRGTLHQLGYGHAGKVGPEFAPAIEGSGRNRHIADWSLYDRHYGPLFDGSAFAGTRRGPRPIPFAYLPINPEWPASYVNWGEPGYEAEFVNVVSEMERHFREKGWTQTRLEMFFNQKKRYMGVEWDGDEVRFPADNRYFLEYGRLLKKALPAQTPVRFVFRADVSWDMEHQFQELGGVVNMWIASRDILSWLPRAPAMLRDRGDILWYYSGPPAVTEPASTITQFPMEGWMWGVGGFVHWLAVSPGQDPWFHFDGGGTALVYSGERFGIESPVPSVRLKIQRNTVQDLALMESITKSQPGAGLKAEAARLYNNTTLADWWNQRPAWADQPTYEWSGTAFDEAVKPAMRHLEHIDPAAWTRVRQHLMRLAAEAK